MTSRIPPGDPMAPAALNLVFRYKVRDGEEHELTTTAQRLTEKQRTTYERSILRSRTIIQDPNRTPFQACLDASELIQKERGGITEEADRVLASMRVRGRELRKVASFSRDGSPIATELRAIVRGLPEKERRPTVSKMIEEGDRESVNAVLGGPLLASGLSKAAHDVLVRAALSRFHSDELQELSALDRAGEEVVRQSRAFLTIEEQEGLHDFLQAVKAENVEKAEAVAAELRDRARAIHRKAKQKRAQQADLMLGRVPAN